MSIKPLCNYCGQELEDFGGLLFSPPNKNIVKKYHICKNCYNELRPIDYFIDLPYSKSLTNRQLVIAASTIIEEKLENDKDIRVTFVGDFRDNSKKVCDDIRYMICGLESLGFEVSITENNLLLGPFKKQDPKYLYISCGSAATVLRFLAALSAKIYGKSYRYIKFVVSKSLEKRPFSDLLNILDSILDSKELQESISISCLKTTQYYTAIKLSKLSKSVTAYDVKTSDYFLEMTNKLYSEYHKDLYVYPVVDEFAMSYFLTYAFITGSKLYFNEASTNKDFKKSLENFINSDYFKIFGYFDEKNVFVPDREGVPLVNGVRVIDINSFNDLIFSCFQLCIFSPVLIKGLENLEYKETNRLLEFQKLMNCYGIKYTTNIEKKEIYLEKYSYTSYNMEFIKDITIDHRIFMGSYVFSKALGLPLPKSSDQCYTKTFPMFLFAMSKLDKGNVIVP
jgi:5-enolpyruvylshikimate-3-phosphate synthase